jgi:hypothetical protein
MKRATILAGLTSITLVFTLVLVGCNNGASGDDFSMIGTYKGQVSAFDATLTVQLAKWHLKVPGLTDEKGIKGIYEQSGDDLTLRVKGVAIGTATLNGDTLTLVVNSKTPFPGTYTFYKE